MYNPYKNPIITMNQRILTEILPECYSHEVEPGWTREEWDQKIREERFLETLLPSYE